MKTFDDYRSLVLSLGSPLPTEVKALSSTLGFVCAEPVMATYPVPPFDNSAMDGFAVRASEISSGVTLPIAVDIPAGRVDVPPLSEGTAARIMTGAPVPAGADAIVPVEQVEDAGGHMAREARTEVTFTGEAELGRHIRLAGKDIEEGELAVPAGTMLTASHLSALASIGTGVVRVHRKPIIGILSTGTELVEPGQPLKPGQIPDSNSLLLRSMVAEAGGIPVVLRTSGDEVADFEAALRSETYIDALITTGGVSAGAFDVVKEYLSGHGIEFHRVAMQPGKPQGCGVLNVDGRPVPTLCFPGNPVSTYVSMLVYGRALMARLTGASTDIPWTDLPAAADWSTPPERAQFLPAIITAEGVAPATAGGSRSHLVYSLTKASALAYVDADVESVSRGDIVKVWIP